MRGIFLSVGFLFSTIKVLSFLSDLPPIRKTEICDNAIDDDGNGLIDLNDPACDCAPPEPVSLIPNPSFEEQNCCPQERAQLDCAEDWVQASEATTDYIHSCSYVGSDNFPPPVPFPDGQGILGFRDGRIRNGSAERNWKEYAGACLISPLLAGQEYTFEFYLGFVNSIVSPPLDISFFGTTSCDHLPFGIGNESLGCPTNGPNWKLLNSKLVSGTGWVKTSITITPDEDIYAIAIGPPCALNTSNVNLYYYFDNLILAESRFFPKDIEEQSSLCLDDFEMSIPSNEEATYQWYKDGVAILGEQESFFQPHLLEGNYSVIEYLDGQCNLSNIYTYNVPEYTTEIRQTICEDEYYSFNQTDLDASGIYVDTIITALGCDSIVMLDLSVQEHQEDYVSAKIFEGDEYTIENYSFTESGSYQLNLQSSEGCDSTVFLDLEFYKVYIPNIFSPNDDGINDLFEIFIEEPNLFIKSVAIFDRWGSRVHYSTNISDEKIYAWDGFVLNQQAQHSVFTYMIEFNLEDNKSKTLVGDLTMIR